MDDYDNEFWTEEIMLKQHAILRRIIFGPKQFPNADLDRVGDDLKGLESAMLRRFGTVRVMQAITSA